MIKNIQLIKTAFNLKELPKDILPEVILCGRSNVGKSSFLNSLFNKKNLARTSSTPGKTRSLNYYRVDDSFYIVDLPGYGYAKVSKQDREYWNKLINDYISTDSNIFLAFHFIDSRHKPTELDIALNAFLRKKVIPYVVVLNKVDKLKQSEVSDAVKEIKKIFPELLLGENLIPYSAVKNTGHKEILNRLNNLFNK